MQQTEKESWKLKLINVLGLSSYIENNLVFQAPTTPGYALGNNQLRNGIEFYPIIKKVRHRLVELQYKVFLLKEYEQDRLISHVPLLQILNKSKRVIIFSHGNASDLGGVYKYAIKLSQQYQCDVICYDYTGYGISSHMKSSEYSVLLIRQGICRDLRNVLRFAKSWYQQIFLWGFSLGSVPTVEVASKYKVSGVILQAPLASIGRLIDNRKSFTSKYDMFENSARIGLVSCPIFIFHGSNDSTIDVTHSELLARQSTQPTTFIRVSGANHNNLSDYADQPYTELAYKLEEFINGIHEELEFDDQLHQSTRNLQILDRMRTSSYDSMLSGSNESKNYPEEPETCLCTKRG